VVHNSRPVGTLGRDYHRSYRYMQRKWKSLLPIETPVVPITRFGFPLVRHRLRSLVSSRPRSNDQVSEDRRGRLIAQELGYE
jgi:hypothetical protein